jgi:hypothetical protein
MNDKTSRAGTPSQGTPDVSRDKIDERARTGLEGQQDSNPGDPTKNDETDSGVPIGGAAPAPAEDHPLNAEHRGANPVFSSGLQNSGEFRVGEKITFGVRNGNILVRKSGSGDEIEVSEATMAGIFLDTLFGPEADKYSANIDRG